MGLFENNPRSTLETLILLLVCCAWTPWVLFPSFPQEALALALSGPVLLLAVGKNLPPEWSVVMRPVALDSGLLYGTSLVSFSTIELSQEFTVNP
jgi:hypothetical protein